MSSLKNQRKAKNFIIYAFIAILALTLTVAGYFVFFHDMLVSEFTPVQTDLSLLSAEGARETSSGIKIETNIDAALKTIDVHDPNARKDGFYNFLVVGRDKAGLNTDVIMVVSFDTVNNKAAILQIPRDTYVEASPLAYNKKVNAIFSTGYSDVRRKGGSADECIEAGMATLSDAILSSFGIVIDRYVHVNIQGFREIVDAIGGVEVTIQQDMYYSDPDQGLLINLKAGTHLLKGEDAEGFVRFRYGYVNADLGRMDAQKIFMTALMKKMLSSSTITKLPKLISVVNDNAVTNLSTADMTSFAAAALKLDLNSVSMFSIQGIPMMYNEVSYVSVYPKSNLEIVNSHFNVFNSPITIDDIKIKILADEPDGYTVNEITASDIDTTPPELSFVNKKRKPASTAVSTTPLEQPSAEENTSDVSNGESATDGKEEADATATNEGTESGADAGASTEEAEIQG